MILLDASYLLHRTSYVKKLQEIKTSDGTITGFVNGFLKSLSKSLKQDNYGWEGVIVCWDSGVPLFRREIYHNYKQNKNLDNISNIAEIIKYQSDINKGLVEKEKVDTEERSRLSGYTYSKEVLNKIIPYLGLVNVRVDNCEADDIIAYYINTSKDPYKIIVSSDRDYYQFLDSDKVCIYDPSKDILIDENYVIDKYKLNKHCWRDHWKYWRAITGDKSDNIPGICLGDTGALRYASQLAEYKLEGKDEKIAFSLLETPKRIQEKYTSMIKTEESLQRIRDNIFMMDLTQIKETSDNPHVHYLCKSIRRSISSVNYIDSDIFTVSDILHEYGIKGGVSVTCQSIYESSKYFDYSSLKEL